MDWPAAEGYDNRVTYKPRRHLQRKAAWGAVGYQIGSARLASRDVQRLDRAGVDVAGPLLWTAGKTAGYCGL